MPSPTSWSNTTRVNLTGIQTIDALLSGRRWENPTLTYSFPEVDSFWSTSATRGYGPSNGGEEPWHPGYEPLYSTDRTSFHAALQQWANIANLQFFQLTETPTNVGDIRAAYTSSYILDNVQAWSYEPNDAAYAGDIWFDSNGTSVTEFWSPGSYEFLTVMHELGHALGLKHPFEGSGSVPTVLPTSLNTRSYTVMSYSANPGDSNTSFSFEPTSLMLLDIATIQHIYGANYNYHAGDDVYLYSDLSTYHHTIWDGGGLDTIQYTGNHDAIIDLQQGHGSRIGIPVNIESTTGTLLQSVNNIWIAYGANIENAMGGQGNDTLIGNDQNNALNGGAGVDTAHYADKRSNYSVTKEANTFVVKANIGKGDTDIIINLERLQFADTRLAIDLNGNAGISSKVLGAIFGAESLSNKEFVGTGLQLLDGGMSYQELAQLALNTKLGTDFSIDAEINLLYQNLVDSLPNTEDLNHWTETITSGKLTSASLAVMAADSDLNTNNIDLIGLSQTGIEFL